MPRSPDGLRPSWGNSVTDRDAKLASLQPPVQQLIVTPNIKLLYLPKEKKCNYDKREHNHKEIGYKNRATMSFPNLRSQRFLWAFIRPDT